MRKINHSSQFIAKNVFRKINKKNFPDFCCTHERMCVQLTAVIADNWSETPGRIGAGDERVWRGSSKMVGSRRNLLRLRDTAFKYFAIEEVLKGGSQEKRDGSQECKILVGNWRRQVWTPCSTSIYGSSLRQGEKPLTLLAAKLAVFRLILRSSSSWTHCIRFIRERGSKELECIAYFC